MSTSFLPSLPLQLSYPLLFGVLLVAGMFGGELVRLLRLPRIIGYVVVGFMLARRPGDGHQPDRRGAHLRRRWSGALRLGRRMDLKWMRRDWTLAASGLAESLGSFGAVFATLLAFNFSALEAGVVAAIAMGTCPRCC
jgi:hypothetical protein